MNTRAVEAQIVYFQQLADQPGDSGGIDQSGWKHSCGTPSCVAGHMTLSRDWIFSGGDHMSDGRPTYIYDQHFAWFGAEAIRAYLGISQQDAEEIVNSYVSRWAYPKAHAQDRQPTYGEVVDMLQCLLKNGSLNRRLILIAGEES